jgi:D-alanyl-lipoteichoic acid acyltransferase DltB (MBOAT superfamily)
MLFNTFEFALFFAICFGAYLLLPRRAQNRLLLLASCLFYAAWDWRFLALLLLSTLVDYILGLRIAGTEDPRRRRLFVSISIVSNLSILGFFKYAGFFAESLSGLAALFGLSLPDFALEIVLPVGISFYTFQKLSYTIDIYRRSLEPTRNLLDFALFVTFFPQLVAGPIERASRLLPQILGNRRVSWEGIGSGAWLVLWGLFKKVVIADNLAPLVDAVYAQGSNPTAAELLVATYAFACQIYCDFSGYSDITRGIGRMMGFQIALNFNLPYGATSPAEFWRRWHITLSTWLRDYVFFSLGGSGAGRWRVPRRIAATMLLAGLWHGAAWPFALWGVFHGAWLILHRMLLPLLQRVAPTSLPGRVGWHALRVGVTFQVVCFSFILFRAESLSQVAVLLGSFAGNFEIGLAAEWLAPFALLVAPLVLMQVAQALTGDLETVLRWPAPLRTAVYLLVFLMILLLGEDGAEPFIYFQF